MSRTTAMAGVQGTVEPRVRCHRHAPAAAVRVAPTLDDLEDDTMDTLGAGMARPRSEYLTALGMAASPGSLPRAATNSSVRTADNRPNGRCAQPNTGRLVAVLLYEGVQLFDVAGPVDASTTANEYGGRYVLKTASLTGGAVHTCVGVVLEPAGTGTSAARFVEQVRLEGACTVLVTTTDSLDAVARHAGFGSRETMHRVFQRELGVTSGACRARFSTTAASPHQRLIGVAP